MENNYFELNGDDKKETSGTTNDTKFTALYECILMYDFETFSSEYGLDTLTIYFFIWTHGEESLEKFLEDLDECDENLKFIHESSKENISFLDLDVKLMDGKLTTDSQIKPTDKHQYLHFSSHSDHTKVNKNSQTFWLSKIYTIENDYIRHKYETKS